MRSSAILEAMRRYEVHPLHSSPHCISELFQALPHLSSRSRLRILCTAVSLISQEVPCSKELGSGFHVGCWAQVAWVRRQGVGRCLPRAYLQADLDIVTLPGSTPSETLLADAEVIRTVSEVCCPPSSL